MKSPRMAVLVLGLAWLNGSPVVLAQAPAPPPATATPPSPAPADLPAAVAQTVDVQKTIATNRDQQLVAAQTWYASALEKLQADASARGDLESALAAKQERARISAKPPTAKEVNELTADVIALQKRFYQATEQILTQAKSQEMAMLRNYVAVLDELQKRITRQGDLDSALKVKEEKTNAAQRLAALSSSPAGVASMNEPPKGPPPVVPVFGAPLEPSMPPSAAPTPSSTGSHLPLAVQPVVVAGSLAAKKKATDVSPEAFLFDGPPGDGRRGAKGLLWKSDPAGFRGGTSWGFHYLRSGSAESVQIIHPSGRGQAIIHLSQKSVSISTPKLWIEVGYGGGEKKKITETKAFSDIFPLQNGQDYVIMSRLSTSGAYELFVDGQLVVTGRVSGGEPLSLKNPDGKSAPGGRGPSEFKTPDLPLQWFAGWAGIFVGPMDGGENRCSEIRFYPGLAEAAAIGR